MSSSYRPGSYQQHSTHPSLVTNSSSMGRGRSLTPPSFKQSSHLSSMHHLRSDDYYSPYPAHFYMDPSAYYRPYDDPYGSSRFPPFFPSMISSSSRAYGDLYASANADRHRRSRSRSRRRYASFVNGLRRLCVVLLRVIVLNSVASSSASAACSQRFDDRLHLPPNSTFLSLSALYTCTCTPIIIQC